MPDQPNDAAMKAAKEVHKSLFAGFREDGEILASAIIIARTTNLSAKEDALGWLMELLPKLKRRHKYCEDSWYSCPLAEDGCADDSWPEDECNCGADAHNACIEAALAAAKKVMEL